MGGGESKNSQLLKYGGLLSETERETLRAVFSNIAGDSEASAISLQQFKVIFLNYTSNCTMVSRVRIPCSIPALTIHFSILSSYFI